MIEEFVVAAARCAEPNSKVPEIRPHIANEQGVEVRRGLICILFHYRDGMESEAGNLNTT